ncbi:transmembrane protein 238-like [Paroedura picta]|uniref:transmembrane protein 238-like n=1 Tax=Paroedura picta TaxID=143630 RepID=UPI00405689DB
MGRACGGRCAVFLGAALVLDAAGLALVLAGAAGKPTVSGCSLEEFLVLSGALLLFLSLLCWLLWYSGNLRGVPAEELPIGARPSSPATPPPPPPPRRRASLVRLAAKLSKRLSQRRRLAPAASCPPDPGRSAAAPTSAPAAAAAAAAAVPAAASARSSPSSSPLELSHLHPQQGTPGERLV